MLRWVHATVRVVSFAPTAANQLIMSSDEDMLEPEEAALTEEDEPAPAAPRKQSAAPTERHLAIRDNVLKEILACGWSRNTKISPDALQVTSALVRAFALEAKHRATAEAAASAADEVEKEHLERILPQLLLDLGP